MAEKVQANPDKLKVLNAVMEKIEKDFGKGSIMRMNSQEVNDVPVIPTGSITLDMALGVGGYPKGRVVEIYGPESSGKTTLAIHAIAEAQKAGGIAAFIDAEHAFDSYYAQKLGVDVDNLLISQPDNGEQALEIADSLIRSSAIDIIVIDSVAALTPKAEIEGEMGDAKMGLQARLMSQALRKLTASISKTKTVCIFINQLRDKIGVVYGNPETTTGGNALKFYASVRIDIRRVSVIKDGEEQLGTRTKVKVVKNKVAPPFKRAEFDIMFGEGISKIGEIIDLGVDYGVIRKAGSWFSYGERKIGQGRDAVKELLKNDAALSAEIEEKVREAMKTKKRIKAYGMDYTAEDEKLIKEKWDDLLYSCTKICKNDEDWNFIKRAFFLAKEAHQGVRRRSGEPYLLHPIAVAKIVIEEIGLGVKSVVASLLHDVVEDTEYTVEDMERIFGPKIASMVDGLTKMSGVFNADTSEQAEYFRKVLLTLSDDVRVILIKIADRLHNMRTLGSMPMNKQIKITSETIYLFAPLAYRLGLYSIKSELEDLCMKYRFPKQYEEITRKLNETEASRQEFINKFNAPIIAALDRDHIKYEISGRVKSIYSIWSKMQRKQIPFEEIYDLFAIRIVFQPLPFPSEKTQCWQIYSTITDIYTPKPDRLRDWISMPKANGYEALHSTVMGPDGVWVEVQIRTQRMEDIAERGFAAHWKYKHATISQNEDEFDKWLAQIRDALNSPTESAVDFLDNFKLQLYTSEIVVFTPKGEARKMPFGATALDFAYEIHSKIGNSAIGAKINHKIEPITARINSGDQIEIITSDTARPKPEWLDIITTSKAKQAIKSFLKGERQHNIERGQQTLEEKMRELNIPLSGRVLRKIIPIYESNNKEELYSKIGAGIVRLDDLEKVLKVNSKSKILKFWTLFIPKKEKGDEDEPANAGEIAPRPGAEGDAEPRFVIAECCKPIPGDSVVGYRDPASGKIIVHKSTCDELNRLGAQFGRNIVKEEIKWSQHKAMSYLSTVLIRGIDRMGLLLDLAKVVTDDFSINMREVNIQSHDGIFEGNISLYVKDAEGLHDIMDKIRKIKGIESVKRSLN